MLMLIDVMSDAFVFVVAFQFRSRSSAVDLVCCVDVDVVVECGELVG